jgi:CRP-like cAMP-binding protein
MQTTGPQRHRPFASFRSQSERLSESVVKQALDATSAVTVNSSDGIGFRDVLTQYSHALLIHSMRMTGCTGLHTLAQRCSRWILTTLDRVSGDRFAITHEFLAMLLGASRPSVSVVIEDFQRHGMLRLERGRVLIGDRDRLLNVSCDCYEVIRRNYEQVGR